MQTSRFQICLFGALAVGFGYSIASSNAVGYPSGPTVSLGEHPRWSATGNACGGCYVDILTVPDGQVAVVTGFKASRGGETDIYQDGVIKLDASSDATGAGALFSAGNANLVIESGTSLRVHQSYSGTSSNYYIEGYYAQP